MENRNQTVLQQYSQADISPQDANAAFDALTDFLGVLLEIHQNSDGAGNENQ